MLQIYDINTQQRFRKIYIYKLAQSVCHYGTVVHFNSATCILISNIVPLHEL